MRFLHLLRCDMKFQARYGFYLLYGFLTALYMALLVSLPSSWKPKAAAILIFSDPAAMGLFFMGAIVLLEKSQRVTSTYSVSPVKAWEYVLSKVLSLSVIALLVAALLGVTAGSSRFISLLFGTCLASMLFTLSGILVATKITSLNQFLLCTVPVEVAAFLPAMGHLFNLTPAFLRAYPANVCMDMIAGRAFSKPSLAITALLIAGLFYAATQSIEKMWTT